MLMAIEAESDTEYDMIILNSFYHAINQKNVLKILIVSD